MSKATLEKLNQILEKLRWIQPDVYSLPVNSVEMKSGIHFIPVRAIAYISSDVEEGLSFNLKYQMANGSIFYSNHRLSQIEKKNRWPFGI